jgi:hypothetical protein
MIQTTSSSDRAGGTDPVSVNLPKPPVRPLPQQQPQDSISTDNVDGLRTALANQPEVRPEMVAKGMALAADPNYPSADVIKRVAGMILDAPDLSEDQS